MPVNGIELKEGQIWEDNVRIRRTIKRNPSGSVDFPWIGENTEGGGYSTLTNDGRFNGVVYSYYDLNKLIYNPESEEKTAMTNKFNPEPGDKIICNNGEEFICCTLDFLHAKDIHPSKPQAILGFDFVKETWQDWDEDGYASLAPEDDYDIREVIPQSSEASADKKEEVKEEPRYTVEEVFYAIKEHCGKYDSPLCCEFEIKNLLKRFDEDPEYKEYIRLKAIYE